MFRRWQDQQLINAETEQVASIGVKRALTNARDPQIQQPQIAKNAIYQLRREASIRRRELCPPEAIVKNRIGESTAGAPFPQHA